MVFIIMDETSSFKHFCRICKKGFGCGRALGGHMRAHGIGDESASIDDDDDVASDWEENNNKRMYSLRTNPNRLKSCKNCENCGKEFSSWKSFLEHGKCTSDDAESLVSSPGSVDGGRGCGGWSKRKRTLRAEMGNFNSEEEDLANCLMMLANATTGPFISEAEPEAEESCASASKEMNFVAPIACRVPIEKPKGLFECKACKKVFNSHQALGGHRASHKKVKGCFAAKLDHIDNINNPQIDEDHEVITHEEILPTKSTSTLRFDQGTSTPFATTSKKKSKVHECSICHRVFTSGQALGGHKRCHWVTSNSPDTSSLAKFHHRFQDQMDHHIHHKVPKLIDHNNSDQPLDLKLDLNLPATTELDLVRRNRANPYTQPRPGIEPNRNIAINQHEVQVDNDKNNIDCSSSLQNADDEADSKVKLAKLNVGSSSSPWLQVGIGSTANVGSDH